MKFKKNFFFKNILFILLASILVFGAIFVSELAKTALLDDQNNNSENQVDATKLVINEVMSSNQGAYADSKGNLYDWIELYNGSNHDIELKGFGLSDNPKNTRWVFPDVTIAKKTYMIVYLSNNNQEGLYASLSLKSEGESILLRYPNGSVVDQVEVPPLGNNQVYTRINADSFNIQDEISPGFENTLSGHEAFIDSITLSQSEIIISEVLPDNQGNFIHPKAGLTGFIEITNLSDHFVNLNKYAVSDSLSSPFRWDLPATILDPNESVVIYTSNLDTTVNDYHSDFSLSQTNGLVVLSNNEGKIIQTLPYTNVPNGFALEYIEGKYVQSSAISPGYANTIEGIKAFQKQMQALPEGLVINEIMNRNTKYALQNGAIGYDWIEFRNTSDQAINLSDYGLSNTSKVLNLVTLPNVILQPNALYVVFASGDHNLSNGSNVHINFNIDLVESIYLYKENMMVDCMFVAEIPFNYSYGRDEAGGYSYMASPSINAKNIEGIKAVSPLAKSSLPSGIYESNIQLDLSGTGNIYYTLDGTEPTNHSKVFTETLTISSNTVLKYLSIDSGKLSSDVQTSSYFVNQSKSLPIVSLTLDPADYTNLAKNAWDITNEKSAHIEYFDGLEGFNLDCGIELFGGSVRGLPKKSFALKFKGLYGQSSLNYKVFDTRSYTRFDTLILRSGSQDYEYTYFRDILGSSVLEDSTTVVVQAYKTVVLYINGKYWGLYDFREKTDEDMIAGQFNVDADGVNVVRIDGNVTAGSKATYTSLLNYVGSHDMSNQSNYDYVKTQLNIVSYIDFWVAESFVTNNDIINTRFFSSPDYDNGRWNMVLYDLDFAWYNYKLNYYTFMMNEEGMSRLKVSTFLMRNLMKSDEFKQTYLQRLRYNLVNLFTVDRILGKLNTIVNQIDEEMVFERQRWGFSYTEWLNYVDYLKTYITRRRPYLLAQTKTFFNLSTAEYNILFGDLQ